MPIGPLKPSPAGVELYQGSRPHLYGPRWSECKTQLQPDEGQLLWAYARRRFHPLTVLQNGRVCMV